MSSTINISCAFDADNYLGETPIWSVEEGALYWVNCENPPSLHRWSPTTKAHDVWPMPDRIGGVALKARNQVLVVLADGIYDFDTTNGSLLLRHRSPLPAHVKLHECMCDRQGRLWVGSYDHHFTPQNRDSKEGAFFRVDASGLTRVFSDISVANGLAFSPDGRVMYFTDSPTRVIEAFDLDPASGNLSNRRPFIRLQDGEGFPDGATVDSEGCYWLGTVAVGALRRYRPDGVLDRVIDLPFSNPTKLAFGGPNLDILYVTSTKMQIGPPGKIENGGLFTLSPGVRELAEPVVKAA